MKLLKPSWVHHDDSSIFSVDIHPDGSRFATGGQGQDSGKIIIWNMGPVIDQAKENDEKILCQMDHHIACVNVVRWSNSGLFLASGSDDKLVMIWQFAQGGGSYQNLENWKCGHTLRGHSGDVLDLSWSPKDQYLATCSVDNTVIIWNALKFPEIITRLNAHAGMVKGVTWDPTGVFLASQSDDKTVKIWRTLDWSMEKCIDEPFKQCCGNTHVLRLNWSPDGTALISAHAMNNGAPTAQIIDRTNKWNTKLDFVGHRKAVMAVRFFPQILKPGKRDESANSKLYSMCALGSRDRSVSVWLTSFSRPLCVIKDLFDNPIMDLSWCKEPRPGLLACSMDGTVAYLQFNYEEIGYPISQRETEEFFLNKYNYDINAASVTSLKSNHSNNVPSAAAGSNAAGRKEAPETMKFIENSDILLAQEKKQQEQQKQSKAQAFSENSQNSNGTANSLTATPSKLHMLTENHKQVERMMANGRRRITPICVSKPGEYDAPKPFVSTLSFKGSYASSIGFGSPSEMTSRTATEHSTIIVEKRDEKGDVIDISPVKSVVYSKPGSFGNSNSNQHFPTSQKSNQSATDVNMAAATSTSSNQGADKPLNFSNTPVASVFKNESEQPTTASSAAPEAVKASSASTTQPGLVKKAEQPAKPSTSGQTSLPKKSEGPKPTESKPSTSGASGVSKKPEASKPASNQATSSAQQQKTSSKMLNSKLTPSAEPQAPKTPNSRQAQPQPAQKQAPVPAAKTAVDAALSRKAPTTPVKESALAAVAKPAAAEHPQPSVTPHHHHHHHGHAQPSFVLDAADTKSNLYSKMICEKGLNRSEVSLEVQNSISLVEPSGQGHATPADLHVHLLKYVVDAKTKWQIFFSSRICETAGSSYLVACVCQDSTLHLIKAQNGVQVCCPILLDAKAAVLKCNSYYCMCLTTLGSIYVWKYSGFSSSHKTTASSVSFAFGDVEQQRRSSEDDSNEHSLQTLINRQSCASILKDGTFLRILLTEQGVPVIYMSDNRSFFYSLQTQCWHQVPILGNVLGNGSHLLANSSSVLAAHTSDGAFSEDLHRQPPMGPLKLIQSREKNSSLLKTIDAINKSSVKANQLFNKQDFTLVHLESQVNASLGLNSPKEYKFWLMTYARYLIENSYEDKLTELCDFLLGPIYSMNWNSKIMNYNKRDLLKEIVAVIAQNLQLQRIYSYYKQQLNSIANSNSAKTQTLSRLISSSSFSTNFRQPAANPAPSTASAVAQQQQQQPQDCAMEDCETAPSITVAPATPVEPAEMKATGEPASVEQEMEVVGSDQDLLSAPVAVSELSNGSKSPSGALSNSQQEPAELKSVETPMEAEESSRPRAEAAATPVPSLVEDLAATESIKAEDLAAPESVKAEETQPAEEGTAVKVELEEAEPTTTANEEPVAAGADEDAEKTSDDLINNL